MRSESQGDSIIPSRYGTENTATVSLQMSLRVSSPPKCIDRATHPDSASTPQCYQLTAIMSFPDAIGFFSNLNYLRPMQKVSGSFVFVYGATQPLRFR